MVRNFWICASAVLAGAFLVTSATAQNVGMGTTKRGATAQLAVGISKVISENTDLRMRTVPHAGTAAYIPEVNAGNLEFAVANIVQFTFAVKGIELSEGRPHPDLRLVGTLVKFRVGLIVRADSDIRKVSDLRGRRVPSEVKASPSALLSLRTILASANMTMDDVRKVPTTSLVTMWNGFEGGQFDTSIGAVGSGRTKEIASKVGGVRFLPVDPSPEAQARMRKILPGAEALLVNPGPGLDGFEEPTHILAYDYTIFASTHTSDEAAYKVAKALYENEADLHSLGPVWKSFSSENLAKPHADVQYHPGAMRLYKEKGIVN